MTESALPSNNTSPTRRVNQVDLAIDGSELAAISECVARRWLSEGPKAQELGRVLREFTGARYSVFAPNGTLGLFLAFLGLSLPRGSEVIIPNFTFYASATSAIFAGLKPVFVDVDPETYTMVPELVEKAITPQTRALMPVHMYGHCAPMDALLDLARRHRLKVIEDAAQGFGVRYRGRHSGTLGDVGVISFFSDKVLTMGEGAILLTDDEILYEKLRLLRNQGRPTAGVFIHPSLGMNFRITDMQAAVGLVQFEKYPEIERHRLRLWDIYRKGLDGVGDIRFMRVEEGSNLVPFRFPFTTAHRDRLGEYLTRLQIEVRGFFYPLHLQPCLKEENPPSLPVSEELHAGGVCLPVHQHLTESDAEYVVDSIRKYFEGA